MKKGLIVLIVLLTVIPSGGVAWSQNTPTIWWGPHARYDVFPPLGVQRPQLAPLVASSLTTWNGSFTYQGTSYPYTMLGTNPASGSKTTTTPSYIVPLRISFSDGSGVTLSPNQTFCADALGRSALQLTEISPVYQSFAFSPGGTNVGTTQYGDAFQRANFWQTVSKSAPNYHALLSLNTVPTQSFTVPQSYGFTQPTASGTCQPTGYIDYD